MNMRKPLICLIAVLLCLTVLLVSCTENIPETGESTVTETESVLDSETAEDSESEAVESEWESEEEETDVEETYNEIFPVGSDPTYFTDTHIDLVTPNPSKVVDMAVTDRGYDIYQIASDQSTGYRYGCTYLYNEDGSVDAYFACPGGVSGEWDWISYRHSTDGGATWSDEKIVLTPTENSLDHYSVCDPGVVYFNGYYYLGYTSTLNRLGMCNNVFVARSANPDGPFEKWNGSGWGGCDPQPIFYYEEAYEKFGFGEPSFVELNGTLYIYYTDLAPSGDYTMVATADATDENWPATIQNHGVAVKRDTDSLDVKYVEEWGKFVAIAAGDRFSKDSWLGVFASDDGLYFELVDVVREGTFSAMHNTGLSSRRNGRIRISEDADMLRVVYAYGEDWGEWNTRIQPITMQLADHNNMYAELSKNCIREFNRRNEVSKGDREVVMVRPLGNVHTYSLSRESFTLRINAFDSYSEGTSVQRGTESVTFRVEDPAICSVDAATWRVNLKSVGTTAVEVCYKDLSYVIYVTVADDQQPETPAEIMPIRDTYTIYVGDFQIYHPMLRVRTVQSGQIVEYYVDQSNAVVTYEGYDPAIIWVSEKGAVVALAVGETEVTITVDGVSCRVKVIVTDDPNDAFFRSAKLSTNS